MSWSAVDSLANQGITFLVGLVLANLLSPSEYGLIGMITIFISISNTIVDSGISNAIIRKPDASKEDFSTAFIINVVLGVLMYTVLFFCSPLISSFFHEGKLISITRVIGIVVIINSFSIVQKTKLEIDIDFKRQAKISVISSVTSGVIGILLALLDFGVWALVAQQISRQMINAIGLWVTTSWLPSLRFSKESFKYQFDFGWKLLVSQLINTIWNQSSNIVIGRCYSSVVLGQFSRAHQFSDLPSSHMTSIIQRVSFPVLSNIQDNRERLKANYRNLIMTSMFISFVGMLALAACSKSLIFVLIGEKWEQAATFLPILCLNFMLYPVRAINTNMLKVVGRSDKILILEIIKKSIAVGPLLLGVFVSIYWMLWANVFVGVIGYVLNSYFSGKYIKYSTWQQFVDILPSFLFGVAVAVIMFFVTFLHLSSLWTLLIQILVGISLIIFLGELSKIYPYIELKGLVLSMFDKQNKAVPKQRN